MAFGALLLVLIRKAVAARIVLAGSALLILILTIVFRTNHTDGGGIVELSDRNSIHFFLQASRWRWGCLRWRDLPASGSRFCVEPAGRAMRAERVAGFENRILSFVALCSGIQN